MSAESRRQRGRERAARRRALMPADGTDAPLTLLTPTMRARCEDLAFLLEVGEDADRAATRAGWPNYTAAREVLTRYGQRRLAEALKARAAEAAEVLA